MDLHQPVWFSARASSKASRKETKAEDRTEARRTEGHRYTQEGYQGGQVVVRVPARSTTPNDGKWTKRDIGATAPFPLWLGSR